MQRAGSEARTLAANRTTTRVASLTPWFSNAYVSLLYDHLSRQGFLVVRGSLTLGWLFRERRNVDLLHLDWLDRLYMCHRRPRFLRRYWSWWTLLRRLAFPLLVARALGYDVVWTVHQVYPHESISARLDRVAGRVVGSVSDGMIAHDTGTLDSIRVHLGHRIARKVAVIPHGSYVGAYPAAARSAKEVRDSLELEDGEFVFLAFGSLRRYKNLGLLLDAFALVRATPTALVVAGQAHDRAMAEAILSAAELNSRIRIYNNLEYVPDEHVQELFNASDVAVFSRGDGGTSGALMLALSLCKPVIAADCPTYRELMDGGSCGWHFTPDDPHSLAKAMEEAAKDADLVREKGAVARRIADRYEWPGIARQVAGVMSGRRPDAPG